MTCSSATTVTPSKGLMRGILDGKPRLTAEREKRAQGEATAIRVIAEANAAAVRAVGEAMAEKGGMDAANLKVAQQYVDAVANLAKQSNTLIIPVNVSDLGGFVAT